MSPKPKESTALVIRAEGSGAVTVTPAGIEVARRLAAAGVPKRAFAAHLGIAYITLQKAFDQQSDLADAWSAGLGEEEQKLVSNLRLLADKGNVVANLFLLKARHGYREGDSVDPARPNVTIVLPGAASPEQYAKIIEATALPPKPEDMGGDQ